MLHYCDKWFCAGLLIIALFHCCVYTQCIPLCNFPSRELIYDLRCSKELYHRRVFIQVCLQIDPEWGLSVRSVDLKWNPQWRVTIGELNRLCSAISSVSLFLEINITKLEASVALFTFAIWISQFLENSMFSIEMDPRM